MSGNVPYCPSMSGVQILTGYDYNSLHSGTITFSTPFKTGTEPFVFLQIENINNASVTISLMLNGNPTNTSFGYVKRFQAASAASGEDFCWLAIGESAEITSGNIPFCKGDTGVQILTGSDNSGTQTGTINFNSSYTFSSAPKAFMTLVTANAYLFSIELKGSPTTTSFGYCKHANLTGTAAGESFYWLAIGNRSASGNVPVTPLLAGTKIFYGKETANTSTGTVTFPSAFTQSPVVLLSIISGGSYSYGVTLISLTTSSFGYSKRYNTNQAASGEDIWWLAIGN